MPLSDKAKKNKINYSMKYNKSHYKRIPLDVPIAKFDEIKKHSVKRGESVNGFIKRAIDETMINDAKKED